MAETVCTTIVEATFRTNVSKWLVGAAAIQVTNSNSTIREAKGIYIL
jgi:hypothetical protein